jgi:hypothetical protein
MIGNHTVGPPNYTIEVTGSIPTFEPVRLFVDVPPNSIRQVPIDWPADDPKLDIRVIAMRQPNGALGTLWKSWVSTIDQVTGDSWSTFGVELEPQ